MGKRCVLTTCLTCSILTITYILVYAALFTVSIEAKSTKPAKDITKNLIISDDISKLPERVQKMHEKILNAAKSGNIEQMRPVLESNEILPLVNFGTETNPIRYWKSISKDGTGRDILKIITKIFQSKYAILKPGTSEENYIWPYLAELPLKDLTPSQQVELGQIIKAPDLEQMQKGGKYNYYYAGIGKDGTWHFFLKSGE